MTRADQPTGVSPTPDAPDDALAAESRERAVGALLRFGPLRRLWSAHLTSGIGDALALLVLLLLALQAADVRAQAGEPFFGGGYRGVALVMTAVFGARLLATLLFGAVLLGPLSALLTPRGDRSGEGRAGGDGAKGGRGRGGKSDRSGKSVLDRRWTMFLADAVRALALIAAPMWVDWMPRESFFAVLGTVFLLGVAERFWTVAKDSAAPGLLPAPPPEGAAVRPLPDRYDALRRLWLRSTFLSLPVAAIGLVVVTLISHALSAQFAWFLSHQTALGSYVAAGLFSAAFSVVYFLELPDGATPRPRSPLEGLRRPRTGGDETKGKGRTGAVPLLVLACSAVAWAVACAVSLAALHAADLGGGPINFGLQIFALTGGTAAGIRLAPRVLPLLSRRRLLALAIGFAGLALLVAGMVTDPTTGIVLMAVAGLSAGIAAQAGHVLLDLETEDAQRSRMTEHLHVLVRVAVGLGALAAPVAAGFIGPHRIVAADFIFDHGGAAFTITLVGALLLPVAALVLGRTDDRQGVTLRRDLIDALGGGHPKDAPAGNGFFIALEGGDGSGKTTQVDKLAEWIRAKGHEVVVTKEPGATPVGKRLRSILLDVSSAGLSHRAEALLYAADKAEHVDTVIRPALERGAIVLSDRYIDSSVAYQGAGRDLSPTEIARISRWATAGLVPHLTVLLDIAPETARERFTEAPDRLESEPVEFHDKVRAGFLTLAAADPARYLVVDASQHPESVTTAVRHRLDQVLPLSYAEIQAREDARKAAEEAARRKAEEEAARKAEEERLERERQEQMDRLRAEEEERRRRSEELERQQEEARRAEEARQRAVEARRIAENERAKREAEERAREEEIARQRRLAEEEARLRAEAEERRREKQRRAEEALQRAEQARNRAAGTGTPDGSGEPGADGSDGTTAQMPQPEDPGPDTDPGSGAGSGPGGGAGSGPAGGPEGGAGSGTGPVASLVKNPEPDSESERTAVISQPLKPPVNPQPRKASRPSPPLQPPTAAPGPPSPSAAPSESDETALLPRVTPEPGARPDSGQGTDGGWPERTREMPQPDMTKGDRGGSRSRPDWAEETPLDDVPSLADELLGSGDEDGKSGRRRRRGK